MSAEANTKDIFHIPVQTIDGESVKVDRYKNKALLIVNTASECGNTPQYKDLETLHQKYHKKGLTILGVPSNDFGGQEPGSEKEIKKFCKVNYGVTFDLTSKAKVLGESKHALYAFLTSHAPQKGEVKWNFEKFLVNQKGEVVGRFAAGMSPSDPSITQAIEALL